MLTPRRTVLLLAGFIGCGCAYAGYAQLLGWLDGLPQLPAKMLVSGPPIFLPPDRGVSPTQRKLALAFGPHSPETNYAHYATQLEFPKGESSVVLASGPVPAKPDSKRVPLSPFSLAVFGKPKPPHLCQPGEVPEITTIHADRAILEFDQVIHSPNDMQTAKLVRLELVSDFNVVEDKRRGYVVITNNQKVADENRQLVLRTPGPVFYRDPKMVAGKPEAQGPDLWTDAPVEIVDRQNLPRPIGIGMPPAVAASAAEVRTSAAVNEILAGRRSPPPTVTAVGMRVYLEPDPPPGQPKPAKGGPMQGVRKLEFLEQVLVNLWVDGNQSIGGPTAAAPAPAGPSDPAPGALALNPPPAELDAVTGGIGTTAYTARLMNRALLQVDTRGAFVYDAEKSLARFDVVPHSDPNLPNDVQVTKVPARAGTTSLFSEVLVLELNGGPTAAARSDSAPPFKRVHAWTCTPGRFLTVAAQDEAMEAYGQELVHDQAEGRTVLKGAPLIVVRDQNVLTAGAAQRPATLISEPDTEAAPDRRPGTTVEPGPGPARKTRTTVQGPGRVDLFDPASGATTMIATWQISMKQTKELIKDRAGEREQSLFTLVGDAKFDDTRAEYWLKGEVLKLWLEAPAEPGGRAAPAAGSAPGARAASAQPKPARVQAIGDVKSHSSDYDIERAEQFNVFIADAKPVANPAVGAPVSPAPAQPGPAPGNAPPVATRPAAPGGPAPGAPAVAAAPAQEPVAPKEPKPPMKIYAKNIDTWVTRAPAPPEPLKPGAPVPGKPGAPPAPGVKYQLDRAHCEDDTEVVVHQDPTDPTKTRGLDILGRVLIIDGSQFGNVMTVFGWPVRPGETDARPGEVHREDTSLLGPEVVLDQVHNAASVKGRGALKMPANSDLAGGELAQPQDIVIHFRDSMNFEGAKRSARFEGKVFAKQGESWILCHQMNVLFDRPVYFNQAQKKSEPGAKPPAPKGPGDPKSKAPDDGPKIETVSCYPAAADATDVRADWVVRFKQVEFDKTGRVIKTQQLEAAEFQVDAQVRDAPDRQPYQRMKAFGPGELRIWQMGDKDSTGPGTENKKAPANRTAGAPARGPAQPAPAPADTEDMEMKLTVVTFKGRMTAFDKSKILQKATFEDTVVAINFPSERDDVNMENFRSPPRAVQLKCSKELIVWSHKKGDAPPTQNMDAYGNAYFRSDEHEGLAETINYDGKKMILTGSRGLPAQITNRFGTGNQQTGDKITYDKSTGNVKVDGSFGGQFNGGGGVGPKK